MEEGNRQNDEAFFLGVLHTAVNSSIWSFWSLVSPAVHAFLWSSSFLLCNMATSLGEVVKVVAGVPYRVTWRTIVRGRACCRSPGSRSGGSSAASLSTRSTHRLSRSPPLLLATTAEIQAGRRRLIRFCRPRA